MQGVWQAELRFREGGKGAGIQAFDRSQLHFARCVEFGAVIVDGKSVNAVMWPVDLFADPCYLPSVVQNILQNDTTSPALPPKRWAEFLQPAPTTWLAFERVLAKLVHQLLLRARPLPQGDVQVMQISTASSASRAAKRQRQRERRKLARQQKTLGIMDNVAEVDYSGSDSEDDYVSESPHQAMSTSTQSAKLFYIDNGFEMGAGTPSTGTGTDTHDSASMSNFSISSSTPSQTVSSSSTSGRGLLNKRLQVGKGPAVARSARSLGYCSTAASRSSDEVLLPTCSQVCESACNGFKCGAFSCGATPSSPSKCDGIDQPTSFTLMDTLRAQLQSALSELDAGKADACKERLKCAIELSVGLEPYLESVHKPMSEDWQRLKEAAAEVDWKSKFMHNETQHLFHDGMGAGAQTVRTLQFLCRMSQAKRVLQVGMYTGQSALGLAEALPPTGRVVAIERDPFFVEFVRREFGCSPHRHKISIQCGDTLSLMENLPMHDDDDRFELIFVDGSKSEFPAYVDMILKRDLLVPGGILAIDDVLWKGGVYCSSALDSHSSSCSSCWPSVWPSQLPDSEVASVMAGLNERVAHDKQFETIVLPIGNGLTLIRRLAFEDIPKADPRVPRENISTADIMDIPELEEALNDLSCCQPQRLATAPARMHDLKEEEDEDEDKQFFTLETELVRQMTGPATTGRCQKQVRLSRSCDPPSRTRSRLDTGHSTPRQLWPATPDGSPYIGASPMPSCGALPRMDSI